MIILFDVGNTSITCGLYSGGRLHWHGNVIINDIPKLRLNIAKKGAFDNDTQMVVSSVVPKNTLIIQKQFARIKNVKIWVAGKNLPVPISHNYNKISKLGIDRRVNIYGCLRIYKAPFLVIDFGTAITFDYVSAKGVFEGGMIVPGPETSFQALLKRAALLPKRLQLPRKTPDFLGKSTQTCMHTGVLQGYGALTDGLIERFRKHYGASLRVIATGGFIRHLKPFTQRLDIIDPQLSVKSLLILFKNRPKK